MNERRRHARIELPVELTLAHPSIGSAVVAVRDQSDSGLYVWYADAPFRLRSSVTVTVRRGLMDARPTPTIKMIVARVDAQGVGLEFASRSGAHLWHSADIGEDELEVGVDTFRVYQCALIRHPEAGVLVVKDKTRWNLPGCYLLSGQSWDTALRQFLDAALGQDELEFMQTLWTNSDAEIIAPENATLVLVHEYITATDRVELGMGGYDRRRWLASTRALKELSFVAPAIRDVVQAAIGRCFEIEA
ncbi:MAG: PilZ domain-containing protein [Pseudomonadota bacterium]